MAEADERLLYLHRGVFADGEIFLCQPQKQDAARLPDADAGGDVFAKIELLHSNFVGMVLADDLSQVVVDDGKPLGHIHIWFCDDGAVSNAADLEIGHTDDAIACCGSSGIETKDDHAPTSFGTNV